MVCQRLLFHSQSQTRHAGVEMIFWIVLCLTTNFKEVYQYNFVCVKYYDRLQSRPGVHTLVLLNFYIMCLGVQCDHNCHTKKKVLSRIYIYAEFILPPPFTLWYTLLGMRFSEVPVTCKKRQISAFSWLEWRACGTWYNLVGVSVAESVPQMFKDTVPLPFLSPQ